MPLSRRIWLYALLGFLTVVSAFGWHFWPDQGGNFFAETLGIVVTVALVDRLIKWDEDSRIAPARTAALRDALVITGAITELLTALARSSVPSSELGKVTRALRDPTKIGDWLVGHISQLKADSIAPYGAPPPYGNGQEIWGTTLQSLVEKIKVAIGKYLERHTMHGDPQLTDAISCLEENGLFRSLSYGIQLFYLGPDHIRSSMYEDFIAKSQSVIDIVVRFMVQMPEFGSLRGKTEISWELLKVELTDHPKRDDKIAPWRPR